jgi:hypothetical protein
MWGRLAVLTVIWLTTVRAVTVITVDNSVNFTSVPCGLDNITQCGNIDSAIQTLSQVENETSFVVNLYQNSSFPVSLCNSTIDANWWSSDVSISFVGMSSTSKVQISCSEFDGDRLLTLRDSESSLFSITFAHIAFMNIQSSQPGSVMSLFGQENANLVFNNVEFENVSSTSIGGSLFLQFANVTLFTVSFTNCSSSSIDGGGGAIYIHDSSSFVAKNVSFLYCVATADGGALFMNTTSAVFEGISCNSSIASNGGCFSLDGSNVTFSNSSFATNSASNNGGALKLATSGVNVSDVIFINNSAAQSGAIRSDPGNIIVLERVSMVNGSATYAGCMFVDLSSLDIYSSTFSSNSANLDCGCIWSYSSNTTIMNSSFTENTANRGAGAIFHIDNSLTISNSIFQGNQGKIQAGGIFTFSNNFFSHLFFCLNCSFLENSTPTYGGALYFLTGTYLLQNCLFFDNSANQFGGAINGFSDSRTIIEINDSTFVQNFAGLRGGALSLSQGNLNLTASSFLLNTAIETGGAVHIEVMNSAQIDSMDFRNNSASSGGAFYIFKIQNMLFVSPRFVYNFASSGGAVYMSESNLTLLSVLFDSNGAITGGAMFVEYGSYIYVERTSNLSNNHAIFFQDHSCSALYGRGGAIFVQNLTQGLFSFQDSASLICTSNSADVSGGAIFLQVLSTQLPQSNFVFANNLAQYGANFGSVFNGINMTLPDSLSRESALVGQILDPTGDHSLRPGDPFSFYVQVVDSLGNVLSGAQSSITISVSLAFVGSLEDDVLDSSLNLVGVATETTVNGTALFTFHFSWSDVSGLNNSVPRTAISTVHIVSIPSPSSLCSADIAINVIECGEDQVLLLSGDGVDQWICGSSSILQQTNRILLYFFIALGSTILLILLILCSLKIKYMGEAPQLTAFFTCGLLFMQVAQSLRVEDTSDVKCNISKGLQFAGSALCACTQCARAYDQIFSRIRF